MAKKSLFYKIYFSVIGLFVLLLAAALGLLYAWLGAYEAAQPETVMQNLCRTYIQKGNLSGLQADSELRISPYETEQTLNAAFRPMVEDKTVDWSPAVHKLDSTTRAYTITADGEPLLTVELKKQKKGGWLGVKGYTPAGVTLAPALYKTVVITAPSDAQVSVNGRKLNKEAAEKETLPQVLQSKEENGTLVVPQTYTLKNFISGDPEITVAGEGFTVIGEKGLYEVQQPQDAAAAEIQDFALAAAQAYAAYMQEDAPLRKVAAYVDTETDFYKNIKSSLVMFAWDHDSYTFENNRCGAVYAYSDTFYRCRVSFTQTLRLGAKIYRDPFDQYVYLRRDAGGWKVIDMQQYTEGNA